MSSNEYKKILRYVNPIDRKRMELVERNLMARHDKRPPQPRAVFKPVKPRTERNNMFKEDPIEQARRRQRSELVLMKKEDRQDEFIKGVPRHLYMRDYKRRKRAEKKALSSILKEKEFHDHVSDHIFLRDEETIRRKLAAKEKDITKVFDNDMMEVESDNESLYQLYDEYDKLMEPLDDIYKENEMQGAKSPKKAKKFKPKIKKSSKKK